MHLTKQRCSDPDAFPTFQLFILAIVRLAEPIALTSIFPYAWALIKHFRIGEESDASFYAGLLISSFSLAEALMGMYWGGLSDRVGRKPVLLLGCIGTMMSMVVVGLAPNLWVALVGRATGGFLNGNIGVIQTMVGELVKKPEHEPRAYSIMPFVWSIGTIIGPAIGGTFSEPRASFPGLFPEGGLFDRYPYLLPNLVCALLLFASIVLGYFLLEETHPELQPIMSEPVVLPADGDPDVAYEEADEHGEDNACRDSCDMTRHPLLSPSHPYVSRETPLAETSDAIKRPAVDLRAETYGTFQRGRTGRGRGTGWRVSAASSRSQSSVAEKRQQVPIFSRRILAVVLALSLFTYHSMAYDATLPIFLEDDRDGGIGNSSPTFPALLLYSPGGLGLSMRAVGMIMAVNGVIALFVQAVVFPLAAAWIGVYRLFLLVTVLHPLVFVLMPLLLYVPPQPSLLYPAIYVCLAVRNLFGILVYPLLLILIKEATPSASVLGKVNGMAASAGAACRMVAPPISGYLYTVGRRIDCTALAWYSGGLVALVGAVQCFSVERPQSERRRSSIDETAA